MANFDFSLAQFNSIASGDYNAGQIDIRTGPNGAPELVKINNHVWKTSKNNVVLSPERILEVKESFLDALRKSGVGDADMAAIRDRLGLPSELDIPAGKAQRDGLLEARFSPLTRAQVRDILDEFANGGKGHTQASRQALPYENWQAGQATANMSAKNAARRDAVNMAAQALHEEQKGAGVNYSVTDAISLLSGRDLGQLKDVVARRVKGPNAPNERIARQTRLVNAFQGLVSQASRLLAGDVRETPEFKLAGETVKLVKGNDGRISAIVGKGELAAKVKLDQDAETFIARLVGQSVRDADALGGSVVKNLLGMFYNRDLERGMVASEKTSLTRQFASLVLVNKGQGKVALDGLVNGNYNTGILEEMAERALDGEVIGDTKALLDAYHAKLVSDNAGLPDEMKAMLEKVATIPLDKPGESDGEFIVRAPIASDIDEVVKALPPPAPPIATVPADIGGLDGIKDFIAELVFSDDTMVGDVVVNKPGEAMRKMLTSDRNLIAFSEIIKNPALLDAACSPKIADAVKDGLGKMVDILDAAYKKANKGDSLVAAATNDKFLAKFSLFVRDSNKLPGADLAKFDNLILAMANKGCEDIQRFVNDVFKVGNLHANEQGGIVNDPYKDLTADQIKAQLDGKSLNQILDSAANSDSPGQVGFFRQVISTYFTSLGKADKRSCFAAALKYAKTFDFAGLEGDALVSAQKDAVNKFTGAILKGTSPLLQKMMQGLPKDIMGGYADALEDMKSSLAPIPRKIVQAHLFKLIEDSKGKQPEIQSIELEKSLGAASVGEAFLCKFTVKGQDGKVEDRQCVVKIMRHDAERRVKAEAEIFTAAAQKIGPGMAKTWEGQLNQYMTEFDFRNEAANIEQGVALYGIAGKQDHPLRAIAPGIKSMKLSDVAAPRKDVLVAEVAPGTTVDKFFKARIGEIRQAASAVFEQDPATGRIKWVDGPVDPVTGKSKKVPVIKQDLPGGAIPNMIDWCRDNYNDLKNAHAHLIQATKAWFHEALLGSGKFHGDTHSGNLMVSPAGITFIDFGNLYTLRQRDGIDERHELLRVIMGATFREKSFILRGFENLLSPAGKAALQANRPKVEAILDSILSKGRFSYDMVYRLNAVVSELQKLGIELPPAINCFVQSMARLSNTLSEMTTILNQTTALLDAADAHVRQGPAPERDELDLLGKALDFRTSPEGHVLVDDDENVVGLEKNGVPVQITAYFHRIASDEFAGDREKFRPGGSYHTSLSNRLANAADPAAEARRLVGMLKGHADAEHNEPVAVQVRHLDETLAKFGNDIAAADTPEKKAACIKNFATVYGTVVLRILESMVNTEDNLVNQRTFDSVTAPSSFANAVMTTLLNNFGVLSQTFADSQGTLAKDVYTITSKELKVGWFAGQDAREEAIKNDALQMAGDDSYQIDIGV